jgi:hypothetical protein
MRWSVLLWLTLAPVAAAEPPLTVLIYHNPPFT